MTTTAPALLRSVTSVVWLALVALTLVSWWLGTDHGVGDADTASVLVLLVAFAKVRFVGLYFMDLRLAPLALRLLFEGWCGAVCTVLVVMFLA